MWKRSCYNVQAETTQSLTVTHAHTHTLKSFPKLTTVGPPESHANVYAPCVHMLKGYVYKNIQPLLLSSVVL